MDDYSVVIVSACQRNCSWEDPGEPTNCNFSTAADCARCLWDILNAIGRRSFAGAVGQVRITKKLQTCVEHDLSAAGRAIDGVVQMDNFRKLLTEADDRLRFSDHAWSSIADGRLESRPAAPAAHAVAGAGAVAPGAAADGAAPCRFRWLHGGGAAAGAAPHAVAAADAAGGDGDGPGDGGNVGDDEDGEANGDGGPAQLAQRGPYRGALVTARRETRNARL